MLQTSVMTQKTLNNSFNVNEKAEVSIEEIDNSGL